MAIPGNLLSLTTEQVDPNTSGWLAKLNATISLGSGGRNGPGCLVVTSKATGEMQAVTFSSYAVTVGTTYEAFCDAGGASVPERIGIRWLNASGADISIAWGLVTSAASMTWHRISVGGVAPLGAVRAQIVVSAVTTAAGQANLFENFYLGFPMRFAGNLLSFNAEQFEIDSSGWAVETNGTLSRTAQLFSWPVDWYWSGGETITLTVIAAGASSALCTERAPVTPGVEYLGYGYLFPPGTSSTWIELRFYNAAGTQVSATRSTLASPNTNGAYRQIASAFAPATAATASLAFGFTSGTAGQVMKADGLVIKRRTTATIGSDTNVTNVVTYADSNFEQGTGQWAVASGVATIARSTPWGAAAYTDSYSMVVTSSTASTSVVRSGLYPVTELLNWHAEVNMRRAAGGWTLTIGVRWYTASGTFISSAASSSAALPSDGNWWNLSFDQVAPAGAAQGQIEVALTATSTSSSVDLDAAALTQILPEESLTVSDTTASTQIVIRYIPVPVLMTLYRVTGDGSKTVVRGRDGLLENVLVSDTTFSVEDYEVPLETPVSYRAEFYSTTTGLLTGYRETETVTIDLDDRNLAWLKDPARPQLNLQVMVEKAPDWGQPIDQNILRVRGRQNALVLTGGRQGREGSLVCWTQTNSDRESLRLLTASGAPLLWQSHPDMGEPDVYVSVAATAFPRIVPYAPEQWREWTLPLTEVDRPIVGLAGSATWTVQDVLIENATVLSLLDRYATVLDLDLDQRTI